LTECGQDFLFISQWFLGAWYSASRRIALFLTVNIFSQTMLRKRPKATDDI
jgi:hypothetical protein